MTMLHYVGTIWQAMLLLKYSLVKIYLRSGWGVRKAAQNIEGEKGIEGTGGQWLLASLSVSPTSPQKTTSFDKYISYFL